MLEKLGRIPGLVRARVAFRRGRVGWRVHVGGRLIVDNRGRLEVADRTFFISGIVPAELVCKPGAELIIGESVGFGYGVSIRSSASIRIGGRTLVGAMVRIRDADGFVVRPVWIGEDVWIAHGAIIEPGVTIGRGAVVAAGSVVTCNVPDGMMAAGNPARVIPIRAAPQSRRIATAAGLP